MTFPKSLFKAGDKVMYSGNYGCNNPVKCSITNVDYRKGIVVYDTDIAHWGYEDQFELVEGS